MGPWFVYILECSDGSYYTGVTCDLARRLSEHKSGKGARYTRIKGVKDLLWSMSCANRSAALKLEIKIKSFSKSQKRLLILEPDQGNSPLCRTLALSVAGLDPD
ncbi:MAG: GIY-YIG nuclease family protein [Deltaproteobacteria bacterium]|nr:GIY-YIG nuclease family protein [Deltaproteobacteria bacterium]